MLITQPGSEQPSSVAQILDKTLHDALELARAEIALTKNEALQRARSMARSAILFAIGVMLLQAAITTLGVLIVLSQREPAQGFAVVGALVALAVVLGVVGLRLLKANHLQGVTRLRRDVREIAEAVK